MNSLDHQDLYQKLLDASFHFVSFRPRSEKETRSFLVKKLQIHKISDVVLLERVITRLRKLDYVNDEKFAAWWVSQRQTHKPKGSRLIAWELKAKGVAIDMKGTDEVGLARHALAKKLDRWKALPKLDRKKKIYGFLGRRGFDSEVIRHVIDEVVLGKVQ